MSIKVEAPRADINPDYVLTGTMLDRYREFCKELMREKVARMQEDVEKQLLETYYRWVS